MGLKGFSMPSVSSIFSSSSVIGKLENLLVGAEFINPKYTDKRELKNN